MFWGKEKSTKDDNLSIIKGNKRMPKSEDVCVRLLELHTKVKN